MHVNNSILYNKCEKMEVWQTQSDMIQNRTWKVLLHMGTSDEKIQIPVVRVYFKGENKTARCACALPKKISITRRVAVSSHTFHAQSRKLS